MPRVIKHPGGQSKYWYCPLTLPDGKRTFRSTKETNKNEAQLLCTKWAIASKKAREGNLGEIQARKVLNDILESSGQNPIQNETTSEFLTFWLKSKEQTKKEGTTKRYQRTVESFLKYLGKKASLPLSHITSRDIESFRDKEAKEGKTSTTVNMVVKTLRIPFKKAHQQGFIPRDPAASVELIKAKQSVKDPFSQKQVEGLLAVADLEWKGMILIGATAGLRLGDAVNLTWESIDLDRGVLRYVPQKTSGSRIKPVETIILPDLEKYLLNLPVSARSPKAQLFPKLSKIRRSGCNGLSARFQKLMHEAGIYADEDTRKRSGKGRTFNNLTFHSLRHTFVSVMANSGVSEEFRKEMAGHTSDAHARYTHIELETRRKALKDFPSFSKD